MSPAAALHVSPTADALWRDAAADIIERARQAVARHGAFHWALSGGSTPRAVYERLAAPENAAQIDWPRVHVWWSDERDVPADSRESNYGSAAEALITRVALPAANVHRVRTERGAERAAQDYEAELRLAVPLAPTRLADGAILNTPDVLLRMTPRLDLVLLGMGEDGHTASIFPGTAATMPPARLVVAHYVEKVGMRRITFTPRLINAAACALFLVSGAAKADMLRRVLRGARDPLELPSQLVAPTDGELVWRTDASAAAALD